jgi:transcriptional regulator with XRE-family HTH domain
MVAAMGRGGGKTPDTVVRKINEEVEKIGQNATARAIGIPLRSVQKYMAGIAEPSQASLVKLAAYFGVSVWELQYGKHQAWELLRKSENIQESQKKFLDRLIWAISDSDSGTVVSECIELLLNAGSDEHLLAYRSAMLKVEPPPPGKK